MDLEWADNTENSDEIVGRTGAGILVRLALRLCFSMFMLGALFHFAFLDPTILLSLGVIYLVTSYIMRPLPHSERDGEQLAMQHNIGRQILNMIFLPGRFITTALTDGLAIFGIK